MCIRTCLIFPPEEPVLSDSIPCTITSAHTSGLFDRALEGNLSEGRDYLELWMAYCDYMRRRIDFEADTSEEMRGKMIELRTVFIRARSHLNKCELV